MDNTLGFGGYQALVIELGQDLRLNDLGLNDVGNDRDDRFIGINDRAFLEGVNVPVKTEGLQIFQKFFTVQVQALSQEQAAGFRWLVPVQ